MHLLKNIKYLYCTEVIFVAGDLKSYWIYFIEIIVKCTSGRSHEVIILKQLFIFLRSVKENVLSKNEYLFMYILITGVNKRERYNLK